MGFDSVTTPVVSVIIAFVSRTIGFVSVTIAAASSSQACTFLGLDAATPNLVGYDPEHAGKTVHYMLRWLFADGSKSAWGETVSATITG